MPTPSATALLKEITSQKVCPLCVLITSPDRVRRERAVRYAIGRFAGSNYRPKSYSFGEQGRSNFSAFLSDISEPSLFEPTRYVLINAIEQAKVVDLEPLTALLSKKIEGLHVFIAGSGLPNSQNFKKAIDKLATSIAFEPLKGAELRRWTERELKQGGVEGASDEIMELVISLAGEEPEQISALIEKLSLYLDGDKPTADVIRKLTPGRPSASDFELADALLSKKRGATEVLIHNLISQGSSPFMLLGLLTKTFVTLYRIRALLDRGAQQQDIRTSLGISPWLFNKYIPIAKSQSLASLSKHCDTLLRADFRLKDKSIGPAATLSAAAAKISKEANTR